MEEKFLNFIQQNSPDGGFLQSEYWKKFQESVGRKTHTLSLANDEGELIASANIIKHILPIVGGYFYVPRGPVIGNFKFEILNLKSSLNEKIDKFINDLATLAKKNNAGWIRIEPANEEILKLIKENLTESIKLKKSYVDIQPREVLVMDILKSEEDILAGMKQKTRYNIKLSRKHGVSVKVISNFQFPISKQYIEHFLRLIKATAKRDRITAHPESYYRKMLEVIPSDILKLYVAEYEGKVIAANLVLFFRKTATYMHGASDNEHRNLMAPYFLQWQAILDAKEIECQKYDLGGVNAKYENWAGITKFKFGFAPETKPIQFPGSYDIILKSGKYNLYRALQKIKKIF